MTAPYNMKSAHWFYTYGNDGFPSMTQGLPSSFFFSFIQIKNCIIYKDDISAMDIFHGMDMNGDDISWIPVRLVLLFH